jgi:hypothetical protein
MSQWLDVVFGLILRNTDWRRVATYSVQFGSTHKTRTITMRCSSPFTRFLTTADSKCQPLFILRRVRELGRLGLILGVVLLSAIDSKRLSQTVIWHHFWHRGGFLGSEFGTENRSCIRYSGEYECQIVWHYGGCHTSWLAETFHNKDLLFVPDILPQCSIAYIHILSHEIRGNTIFIYICN